MTYAKAPLNAIQIFLSVRDMDEPTRTEFRKKLFATVKTLFGIPETHSLKIELDDTSHPDFAVLIRKKDGSKYELHEDGKWVGWADRPVPVPEPAPVATAAVVADGPTTTRTVYPRNYGVGTPPRRFFKMDIDLEAMLLGDAGFDFSEGVDSVDNVVFDGDVTLDLQENANYRTVIADGYLYVELSADDI